MSEVTFTAEQVKEIRERIVRAVEQGFGNPPSSIITTAVLAAFPLPKVTRLRTFTTAAEVSFGGEYRVNNGRLEYRNISCAPDSWESSRVDEDGRISTFAEYLVEQGDWAGLAKLADICQRPTEEVDP